MKYHTHTHTQNKIKLKTNSLSLCETTFRSDGQVNKLFIGTQKDFTGKIRMAFDFEGVMKITESFLHLDLDPDTAIYSVPSQLDALTIAKAHTHTHTHTHILSCGV